MTGRRRRAVAVLTIAVALAAAGAAAWLRRPEPPDVLVVVLDTVGADRCSLTGYRRPTTPQLDAFAREAVVFEDAWAPASWTVPSHAALFTGRSPASLGLDEGDRPLLPDAPATLAGVLAQGGWATACFTTNGWIGEHTRLTRGFQHVEALYLDPPRAVASVAHAQALTWMTEQRRAGRPFLAFINDFEAHAPWRPPPAAVAAMGTDGVSEPALYMASRLEAREATRIALGADPVDPEVLRAIGVLHDAEIRGVDAELGALLGAMRASGLLDRTLVVVTSDHGEGLGRKGWLEHGVFLDRHLLRVPLVVRPPGGCAPRRVRVPVELRDVLPTVLEACGLALPPGVEGRSLLTDATPRTPTASESPRPHFLAQMRGSAPGASLDFVARRRRSAYDGRHHLLTDDRGTVELYEVAADPDETRDLAAQRPGVVAELLELAGSWAAPPR